jgi:hypothetical protein
VAYGQELLAVAVEFAGELGGWCALTDAAEDEHQLGRRAMGLLQRRAGVGIEDAAAVPTAVIEHGLMAMVVEGERVRSLAVGTVQTLGMKDVDQKLITRVGVHEIENWEVHPRALRATASGTDSVTLVEDGQ